MYPSFTTPTEKAGSDDSTHAHQLFFVPTWNLSIALITSWLSVMTSVVPAAMAGVCQSGLYPLFIWSLRSSKKV
jgi:hypothetical protein